MAKQANIFVLIDGLGWEWVKCHPFLKSIAPYRRPLESVLGYSTAAIPSILTGCYPEQHGRLSLFYMARDGSPFNSLKLFCKMPPKIVENRYARYIFRRATAKINRFTGYFSIYYIPLRYLPMLDICERSDIYKPGGIPGSTSIFDLLKSRDVKYVAYSYHDGPDFKLIQMMEKDLRRAESDFYFLYLAGIDAFLHLHSNDPPAVALCLERYSAALNHLYDVARATHGRARIHVFADHGMAPTRQGVDVQGTLDKLNLRSLENYLCLLDSTMARFWFFSRTAREQVMGALSGDDGGQWLSESELRSLHAWFDDHRYGEEIYLMPEGSVIAPSHMGRTVIPGMHGFHPSTAHSRAAFLSSEDYGTTLNHITDLFGLMQSYC